MLRSRRAAEAASYLFAAALVTVHFLFLPYGGYERMLEGKYFCFLLLSGAYAAAMLALEPFERPHRPQSADCIVFFLVSSAISALASPYGTATLLGGPRRDGLLSLALYGACFFFLSRRLRPDRRLLYLAAVSVTLCDVLTLAQLAGRNPLRLYPEGLGYWDGDAAYVGFYAGTGGNIDFTAFLLALAVCVFAAALVRERLWPLLAPLALTLCVLHRLGVAAAWAGLAFAAVWSLPLLFPRRKVFPFTASVLLSAAALTLLWRYDGGSRTLAELSAALHGEWDPAFGSARAAIWRDCLPLVRERPLLGGGPGTLYLRGLPPLPWLRDGELLPAAVTAAHSEYLHTLLDGGALGLLAYLALLLGALVRCFRRAEQPRMAVCGAALLCYAAMAAFSISTPVTAPYVWLLLALADGA